jgi:ABC-2 type transport system ATP-binding protein
VSSAAPAAIRTEGLTKLYGRTVGIQDLTLEVHAGEVFGFLGPNGAGKTTTIRLLLDFLRPTRGRAEVLGLDARRASVQIRRQLGYLPGDLELYERLSGRELLAYFGDLRGGVDGALVARLADRLDLDLDRRIGALSKGNRQKVGLVQAFMHRSRLLVLDEPTSGLDPLVQHEFHRIVREATEEGAAVFLSSHVLVEVERTVDRVGIVRAGELVVVEVVEALKRRALRELEVHFAVPPPAGMFERLDGVRELARDDSAVRFAVQGSLDRLVKAIAEHVVVNVISREPDLEEIFLGYYREAGEDA